MTDIKAKALALVNEVLRESELPREPTPITREYWKALCRAIEQHEAFKQEVSDAITALLDRFLGDSLSQGVINGHLHEFIIPKPKPDPLVEALEGVKFDHYPPNDAKTIRAALDACGLEIREKKND